MKYDGKIDIAVGHAVNSKTWKNKKWAWSYIVEKLSNSITTSETYKEYISASKSEQGKIKDVGGYVGAYLRNGRRHPQNVVHRQLITLDIDFAHRDFWDDFQLQFGCSAVLHSTHKHHEDSPRFRLIIPLSREANPDEYVAVSRQVAGIMGIELFDNTTFETNRLMFWPSTPSDMEYYFRFQDGKFLDVDDMLDLYVDWTDSSEWPTSQMHFDSIKTNAQKQEDPENKKGLVGAFCRTYDIHESIEKFLQDKYDKVDKDRYTFKEGTTAAGLITYQSKFAYSHHGTDPCSGKLCNSFDLVRIHLYGHLDNNPSGDKNSQSFKKMQELCLEDSKVKKVIASDRLAEAIYEFADEDSIDIEDEDLSWMEKLEVNSAGKYLSTASNLSTIFSNDIRLKGLFKNNKFDGKKYIFGTMPWRLVQSPEPIKNVDYSGVRSYMESIYGIVGSMKIEDALELEFEKNAFHPIRDYIKSLEWDGEKRIDKLLIEYFGAKDNEYSRQAIRKTLVACVARVFDPGVKFDLVLTLVGDQGTYKSTFVKKLGMQWFSDTFMTVHGKEALEQIQGAWIIEMAELSGLRKAEVESVKHFISKQEDTFRPAYARTTETYLRQCVFIGTTNNSDFLRDPSGNRRFIPIDVNKERCTKSVIKHLTQKEIDMIWAEAYILYKKGEKLYMDGEASEKASIEQKKHSEYDSRAGIVEDFLNMKLPESWSNFDIHERRMYLEDHEEIGEKKSKTRKYVCAAEIWCECFGKDKETLDRYKTKEINEILKSISGWKYANSTKRFKLYGTQRYYEREQRKED